MANRDRPEDVRQRADWMAPTDDAILELIEEEGNLTPQAIEDFGVSVADHAGKRCSTLAKYGLLERISRGLYRLTDKGEGYLAGDVDASELKPTNSDDES